jgi:hypothetical protein
MEIQVALDAPSQASAIAQEGIVPQGGCEFGKLSKVLGVKLHPVGMAG